MIRSMKRYLTVGAVAVITALSSNSAMACAVCFGGETDNRWAFIGTTALLTFLPLIIFGTGVAWFRRRVAEHAENAES